MNKIEKWPSVGNPWLCDWLYVNRCENKIIFAVTYGEPVFLMQFIELNGYVPAREIRFSPIYANRCGFAQAIHRAEREISEHCTQFY